MLVSLWKKLTQLFHPKMEVGYDNVMVNNAITGEVIKGHDALGAYLEKEKKLVEKFGHNLIFQIYRANPSGTSVAEIQGPKIGEYIVQGDFVPGNPLVREVHSKLMHVLSEMSETHPEFKLGKEDR